MDLEKLRRKLDQLKNPGKKRFTSDLWKPKPKGEISKIRFIKYPYSDDPFIEKWFHYRIGEGRSILCPRRNFGKICPICDLANKLNETGDPQDKELARDFWPKQRVYGVVVDREDPELTPKFYGFGKTVYTVLIEHLLDEEYSDYMDPINGIDATIKSEVKGGKAYPETSLTFSRKSSPLAEEDKIQEIMKNSKTIDEIFQPMPLSEIQKRLDEMLNSTDDSDDSNADQGSVEVVKGGNAEEALANIDADFEKALAEANTAE